MDVMRVHAAPRTALAVLFSFFSFLMCFSADLSADCAYRDFNANEQQVVDAYIAYYGRPADPAGLAYWAGRLGQEGQLSGMINAFGDSVEFVLRFGHLSSEQLIRNLYVQLFGRQPDGPGLAYWVAEFESGRKSLQRISLDILAGARNEDRTIIENRNRVARHYISLAERHPETTVATEALLTNVFASESGVSVVCNFISALFGEASGGDSGTVLSYTVGGEISGLRGVMTLSLEVGSTTEIMEVSANGAFRFTEKLTEGDFYNVSVSEQPTGQSCKVSQSFGEVTNHDVRDIVVTCVQNTGRYRISGTIVSAANIDYDWDVNDLFAPYQSNDTVFDAQPINNVVTLHGFASEEGTWTSLEYDRFVLYGDEYDFYKVSLQKGQLIQMQVVDYDRFEVNSTYEGDLDLVIMDSQLNLLDMSNSTGEYETLVVPEDGEYYIVVMAYSGISKYVLQLLPPDAQHGARMAPVSGQRMDFVPDQVIMEQTDRALNVRTAAHLPALTLNHQDSDRPVLATIDREAQYLRRVRAAATQGREDPLNVVKAQNPESYARLMTLVDIKRLRQTPGVTRAEPNYRVYPMKTPNDTHYPLQWHYPVIQLPQAWDITTGESNEVVVAVIDTGVITELPDLKPNLVDGYDFISDPESARDGDGIDNDPWDPGDSPERGQSSYHGTHVAGTIAASTNDQYGVAGVSWGARIMPLRALGRYGGTTYDIVQAVRYAAGLSNDSGTIPARRADIINLSLGGGAPSMVAQEAYAAARQRGVIVVASAGNSASDQPGYPASYEGVISVSATDIEDQLAPYSNFGQTVDVAAPGGDISKDLNGDGFNDGVLSALVDDTSGNLEPMWQFYNGTSMAAPHVAGVLALMKSVYPELTPDQVDRLLAEGELTDDLGSRGWDQRFGYGRINAYKAVLAAQRLANSGETPEPPDPRLAVTPTQVALGFGEVATLTLSNQGGGQLRISEVTPSARWLTVFPQQTDAQGLGTYQVRANRSGLLTGTYSASVDVVSSDGQHYRLPVTLQVGDVQTQGRIIQQYVMLLDANTLDYVAGVFSSESNGEYTFLLEDVPVGQYYLFSSSDIDHDTVPCVSGEVCGAYPSLESRTVLEVLDHSITDARITVNLLSGLTERSGIFRMPGGEQAEKTFLSPGRPVE